MRRRLSRSARARQSRGLTLLELVVAVLVLALGSVAALRSMDQSRLAIGGAMPRLLAQVAARNRAEELRLYGVAAGRGLPAEAAQGPYRLRLTQEFETTAAGLTRAAITARAPDGPGVLLVTFLPPDRPPGAP